MNSDMHYICPRCEYPLVPVHSMDQSKRTVIGLSCPEPYCDHMQMVPMGFRTGFEVEKTVPAHRAAH